MDNAIMTHLAPRRTHLRTTQHGRSWQRVALLAGLSFLAASSAQAQTLIGGNRAPAVSVDLTVLEQLGPAPNLPQLFGASHRSATDPAATAPRPTARPAQQLALQAPAVKATSTKKHPVAQRTAHRSTKDRTPLAQAPHPQRLATAPDESVHLVSPAAQAASGPRVAHDQPFLTPPIQSTAMATNSPVPAPAPMPKLPQSTEPPAPPVLAPAPAHDEAPRPALQPPIQAHNDNAPVPLTAAPQAPTPAATANAPAAPVTDDAVAGGSRPTQVQVASAASMGNVVNTVKFAAGTTDLPTGSKSVLDTVAGKLLGDDALRVQLVAHATGGTDQAMEARRVSLARAVAVRAYLIDKGVRSLRMDVRALGNRSDDGPATDQVDLLIVSQ
jgi:outer membrane protein OmpA-like peptidoglycan-associated protein